MTAHAAPDIRNYYIGKGVLSFKKTGDMTFRDLGNVGTFEWTPTLTKLDHFSSRAGTKTKDRTVVTEKAATVHIIMDEWSTENLALALLGDINTDTAGDDVIDIFSQNSISGALKFVGANEVGPVYTWIINLVEFTPGSNIDPISDAFGTLDIVGDAATVNGKWGTITKTGDEA